MTNNIAFVTAPFVFPPTRILRVERSWGAGPDVGFAPKRTTVHREAAVGTVATARSRRRDPRTRLSVTSAAGSEIGRLTARPPALAAPKVVANIAVGG